MKNPIDWQALAQQLAALHPSSENGGDEPARRALDLIIGEEQLRAAIDHYIAHRPGSELIRSVLRILHSWVATQYCYEVYRSDASLEVRRTAVELLRSIADSRALPWVEEFLANEDEEIQDWGLTLVDQLLFSGRAFPEECVTLLDTAEQHANLHIRTRAAEIRRSLQFTRDRKNENLPQPRATEEKGETGIRHLLGNGTNVNLHNEFEQTVLPPTTDAESTAIVRTVHSPAPDAAVDLQTHQRRTTLLDAVEQGDRETVALLLTNGASVNEQNKLGHTPLGRAAEAGNTAMVRALLEHGVTIDVPDLRGYTPLLAAADAGCSDIVRLLLDGKAAVNAKSTNGDTALMLAAVGGHKEAVDALLEKGAVVSARNRFGRTALMMAACSGKPAIVEALLTRGASINTQDWRGHCALIDALSFGHGEIAVLLLAHGAVANAQDSFKRTPLLLAAKKGYIPIVQALLEKGAGVNVQDEDGRTPLFIAVGNDHPGVVKLLLDAGAIPDIPDLQGRTAVTVAKELGNDAILQLLKKVGVGA